MQITERIAQDAIVLDLNGRLTTVDEGAQRMRERVTNVLGQGQSKVLLNFGGVPYMDSGALGELVRCSLAARKTNGSIKLFGLTGRLINLLTITKLITEFDTYDTEEDALKSFLVTA
jgi:anti-sigma B factor antagonist